jgi:mannose-6-phosphate isomerase-like protein (cupin superfamily)
VDVCNRHATFADRSGATLDRTGAHVACGEHPGSARFHRARRAIHFLPGWGLRHYYGTHEGALLTLAPGTEPPLHVHSREDELFYVLDGEFDVYVGEEAFKVKTGECVFLPKFEPHAFVIRSTQLRVLALFSPAGLEEAFRGMSSPAKRLALPTKTLTYSTGDVKTIAKRLNDYGVRILSPEEVAEQMPLYSRATQVSHS